MFESSAQEMSHMTNKSDDSSTTPDNASNNDQWREPVIRLRGLPYNSSKEDVTNFFSGTCEYGYRREGKIDEGRRWLKVGSLFSAFRRGTRSHLYLGLTQLVGLDIAQNGVHISSSKPADRKSTRLNSSHSTLSRMPSSA